MSKTGNFHFIQTRRRRSNSPPKRRDGSQYRSAYDDAWLQPTLVEDSDRDIRFIYKQPDPAEAPQQPPGGMPPGGGMPGMQMGGGMGTPGALPSRNISPQGAAQMARQVGMANPGGEGMGLRNRGPASPQNRTSMGAGAPFSSVQQRGSQPNAIEQANQGVMNARNPRGA